MTVYDALLQFRCRYRLTCEQLGKLLEILPDEIRAIEQDAAVLQIENVRKFREVMRMTADQIKAAIPTLGPGEFSMPRPRREALRWRWRNGLTYETAAKILKMEPKAYRLAESDAEGSLLQKIRKVDRTVG